jgi:4-amino-4-deoxy-L-arabinose transferase-like glycosyltransferase
VTGAIGAARRRIAAARRRIDGLSYGRAIGLITAIGAVLRLAILARQPLGYDEDFTALVVHQPVDRMIDIVSRDSAPPLFYLAERAVVAGADLLGLASFGGPGGPVVLRLVPSLAGIAAIPLLAAMARRIGGDRAGIWAALFAALVPTTVMLSGFVRMYGLAATLTVAAALLMWRAVEKRASIGRWAAYVAAAAAAVWTDYFCAVALAGILVAANVALRPGRRVVLTAVVATGIGGATILPWLAVARAQFQHSGQAFWVPPLGPSMLGGTSMQLFMGPPIDWGLPFGMVLVVLQTATAIAGFAALAWSAVAWRRLGAEGRRAATYCLLAAGGVAILAAVSIFKPILDARYASVMWLPLLALVGAGLAAMPRRVATTLLAVVTVTTLALSVVVTHSQTSELVPDLEARVGQHDIAVAQWDHYLILLDESSPTLKTRLHVLSTVELPWFVGTAAYPAGAVLSEIPADVAANQGRVFWVAAPGVGAPTLPPGYHSIDIRCVIQACLTVYGPGGS